jgi:competence protein ComGC
MGNREGVNSQAELYKLDHTDEATLSKLVSNGNITQKQADTYNEYYTKIRLKHVNLPIRAFTLLESLLTLSVTCICDYDVFSHFSENDPCHSR